jgi:hypothetical protein
MLSGAPGFSSASSAERRFHDRFALPSAQSVAQERRFLMVQDKRARRKPGAFNVPSSPAQREPAHVPKSPPELLRASHHLFGLALASLVFNPALRRSILL